MPEKTGTPAFLGDAAWVVHAGTAVVNGALVATGGRVLCATSRAADLDGARERAYELFTRVGSRVHRVLR